MHRVHGSARRPQTANRARSCRGRRNRNLIVRDVVELQIAIVEVAHDHVARAVSVEIAEALHGPRQAHPSHEVRAGDLIVANIVDLESSQTREARIAQDHVAFAGIAAEIAEPLYLPIQSYRPEKGRVRNKIVADVVDLEPTGAAVAQQHVGGIAAEESAEAGITPIRSDPTELISRQDRVVADVVDFVLAHHRGRRVRSAQDHVGGGACGRRRVRLDGEEEAVVMVIAVLVGANDLTSVVDAKGLGA